MPGREPAQWMAGGGSALFVLSIFANRPGIDAPQVSTLQGAGIVLGGALAAAGFVLIGRRRTSGRWRPPVGATGVALVLGVVAADGLGVGAGPGIGSKSFLGAGLGLALLLAAVWGVLPHRSRLPLPLAIILLAGLVVRGWFMASYRPGFFGYYDATGYLIAGNTELFSAPYRPAGEPMFVWILRHLSSELSVTVAAHHAVGLATAVVIYLATRRAGAGRWLAAVPAAGVALGGSQLFLEHSVMSEPLFTLLVTGALYCAVRASSGPATAWWAGAGGLLALATIVRPVGFVVVLAFMAWSLARSTGTRNRVLGTAALGATAALIVFGYVALHASVTGDWSVTRAQGFTLYGRVAGFADCSAFTPPAGLERLCQDTDPAERPPATEYINDPKQSPALQAFGAPPTVERADGPEAFRWEPDDPDARLGEFAREVVRHQPLDYLSSIAYAMANAVVTVGPPRVREWDTEELVNQMRSPEDEEAAAQSFSRFYTTQGYLRRNAAALDAYGRTFRLEGPAAAMLLLVVAVGLVVGRGRARTGAALFFLAAFALHLGTAATLYYDARYATPTYGFLLGAGALAAAATLERRRDGALPVRGEGRAT